MISVLRDDTGRITAVCEYLTFKDGQLTENGPDVFIGEIEIDKGLRWGETFKRLISEIYASNGDFQRVVWFREYKYPGRGPRIYTREQILRHLGV